MAPPPPQRAEASSLLRVDPPANVASVLNAYGFCLGALPPRPQGPTTPVDLSTLAFSRSMQPQQTRITPPLRRTPPSQNTEHPPGFIPKEKTGPLVSMSSKTLSTPQQRHSTECFPGRAILGRLPGPHLTRSCLAFSIPLTTTVFSQRSAWWFSICLRGPMLKGHYLHQLHSCAAKNGDATASPPHAAT